MPDSDQRRSTGGRPFGVAGGMGFGADDELEPVDREPRPRRARPPRAGRRRRRAPARARRRRTPGPPAHRRRRIADERRASDRDGGRGRPRAAFASADADQERERAGDRERRPQRSPIGRAVARVEEHQRADHERDRAGDRQGAVLGTNGLATKKREPRAASAATPAPRERGRSRGRSSADAAARSRPPCPGRRGRGAQSSTTMPTMPIEQHQRDDVRVDQEVEQRASRPTSRRARRARPAASSRQPFGTVFVPSIWRQQVG